MKLSKFKPSEPPSEIKNCTQKLTLAIQKNKSTYSGQLVIYFELVHLVPECDPDIEF